MEIGEKPSPEDAKNNLFKKIFNSFGFSNFNNGGKRNEQLIKTFLNTFYAPLSNNKQKQMTKTQIQTTFTFLKGERGNLNTTLNMLLQGSKNAQDYINKFMISRLGMIVGEIKQGGQSGRPVRIDHRATYHF